MHTLNLPLIEIRIPETVDCSLSCFVSLVLFDFYPGVILLCIIAFYPVPELNLGFWSDLAKHVGQDQ